MSKLGFPVVDADGHVEEAGSTIDKRGGLSDELKRKVLSANAAGLFNLSA